MTQSVSGRKTQTRRLGSLKKLPAGVDLQTQEEGRAFLWYEFPHLPGSPINKHNRPYVLDTEDNRHRPRYYPGETVYIKETFAVVGVRRDQSPMIAYREGAGPMATKLLKWKNKMFMPAAVARHHIEILKVWAERVADISEADAIAEGFTATRHAPGIVEATAKQNFIFTFEDINPGFDLNAWCWVYQYKIVNSPA